MNDSKFREVAVEVANDLWGPDADSGEEIEAFAAALSRLSAEKDEEIEALKGELAKATARADSALGTCCSDRPGSGFICHRSNGAEFDLYIERAVLFAYKSAHAKIRETLGIADKGELGNPGDVSTLDEVERVVYKLAAARDVIECKSAFITELDDRFVALSRLSAEKDAEMAKLKERLAECEKALDYETKQALVNGAKLQQARAECARAVEKYHAEIKRGREACDGIVKIAVAEAQRPLVEALEVADGIVTEYGALTCAEARRRWEKVWPLREWEEIA